MELPQQADRIADTFEAEGFDAGRKQAVLGHLRGQKDQASLDKTVTQILRNGGPEAELVSRIFNRPYDSSGGQTQRTVNNKPLEPIQKGPQAAGTGGPADESIPHEEPHTSIENPPVSGHPKVLGTAGGDPTAEQVTDNTRRITSGTK